MGQRIFHARYRFEKVGPDNVCATWLCFCLTKSQVWIGICLLHILFCEWEMETMQTKAAMRERNARIHQAPQRLDNTEDDEPLLNN